MPTEADTKPDVDDKPPEGRRRTDKPDPPAPSVSEDDVRSWVREELANMLAGGKKPDDAPDLSTDKKLEEYVRKITTAAVDELKKAEAQAGKPPVDDKPDETPEPENEPQQSVPWQEKMRKFLWGPG